MVVISGVENGVVYVQDKYNAVMSTLHVKKATQCTLYLVDDNTIIYVHPKKKLKHLVHSI